jgi:hypothetical protein
MLGVDFPSHFFKHLIVLTITLGRVGMLKNERNLKFSFVNAERRQN